MTKYTKKQRKQIAAALRQAKKKLPWSKEPNARYNICYALSNSHGANLARGIIEDRLGDLSYVTSWLWHAGYLPAAYEDWDWTEIQAYRHRWVDALIEEFSK